MIIRPKHRPRAARRRGIALIWVAIMGTVLVGLLGLAIDSGYVYLVSRQLQDAADAAALSGAIDVRTNTLAQTQTAATQPSNTAGGVTLAFTSSTTNDSSKDIVVGNYDSSTKQFTRSTVDGSGNYTSGTPDAVQVTARRTTGSANGAVHLFFGPIVGISTAESKRTAIAQAGGTPGGAGLVVLGQTIQDINIGNATLQVVSTSPGDKARIWVNSNSTSPVAVAESSNATIITDDLYVHGGSSSLQLSGTITGVTTHTNSPILPDPLAFLQAPSTSGFPTDSGNGQYNSGNVNLPANTIYPKGIKVSGANVTLNQGIYYIGSSGQNTGLDLSSGSLTAANGTFIYLAFGSLTINGGVSGVTLTPPTSGAYAGVSVFQAHGNTAQATLTGGANLSLNGALYFPDASLVSLSGSGGVHSTGNQIIANAIKMTQGTFNLTYNGNTAFKSNAILVPNRKPYLVK